MRLDEKNIRQYIEFEPINISKQRSIWSLFLFCVIIAIPCALFGKYYNITRGIIIPLVVVFGIWTIYLSYKIENKTSFTLFLGCISLFTSIICVLAAYKIIADLIDVEKYAILSVLLFYLTGLILNILNVLKLIKKGYYKEKINKSEGVVGIIFATSILGLGIGRVILGKASQEGAVIIIASGLMFFSFVFLIGTHNLLKYYFIKRLGINSKTLN